MKKISSSTDQMILLSANETDVEISGLISLLETSSTKRKISIAEKAMVHHYKIANSSSVDDTEVQIGKNASYHLTILDIGKHMDIKRTFYTDLSEGARANISMLTDAEHSNISYEISVQHLDSYSHSHQTITSIVKSSQIDSLITSSVQRDLCEIYANQIIKVMDRGDSKIIATPILDIFSKKTIANHGLAIGKLDESMLEYLGTRGLDTDTAVEMIRSSLLDSILVSIKNSELQKSIIKFFEVDVDYVQI